MRKTKNISKKLISILLSGLLTASSFILPFNTKEAYAADGDVQVLTTDTEEPRDNHILIEVPGTMKKQDIQAAVDRINEIRWEACKNGYPYPNDGNGTQLTTKLTEDDYVPITYSLGLEKWAIVRAAESSLDFAHVRLNTVTPKANQMPTINGTSIWLENLAANYYSGTDLVTAINQWYGEKNLYVNGESGYGHYQLMINPKITCFGMGIFTNPDTRYQNYIAGEFSHKFGTNDMHASFNYDGSYIQLVELNTSYVTNVNIVGNGVFNVGDEDTFYANVVTSLENNYTAKIHSGVTWSSSDPDIITIDPDTGEVEAISSGEATITVKDTKETISQSFDVLVLPEGTSIVSISDPEPISTTYNVKPTLPEKIDCELSNGQSIQVGVKWDEYDNSELKTDNYSNDFTVKGHVLDMEVTQSIHVAPAKITKIYNDDIDVTVDSGVKPKYESFLSIVLENGISYGYPITWENETYYKKREGGDFKVKGICNFRYDGANMPIEVYTNLHVNPATVTSVELKQDGATITTNSGTVPAYPKATVTWSNGDVTEEDIEWYDSEPTSWDRKYMAREGGSYELTGAYEDWMTSITVIVNPAYVSSVALEDTDTTRVVACGTAPVLADTANATWSNGDTTVEAVTWDDISQDAYNIIEGNVFTVGGTCKGYTVTTEVTVNPATIKSIDDIPQIETPYLKAPALPEKVNVHWSNGSEREEPITWNSIPSSSYSTAGKTFKVKGTITDAEDKTHTVEASIKVVDRTLLSISWKEGNPTSDTSYYSYSLDDFKGTVIASYDNGQTEEVEVTTDMISGFNADSTDASQSISITYSYGDVSKSINSTIYLISRTGIRIDSLPDKLNYIEEQSLDYTGFKVVEVLSDNSERVIPSTEYSIDNFSGFVSEPEVYGDQVVTFSIYGFSADFNVNVRQKEMTKVTLGSAPNKLEYIQGQALDLTGMVVNGVYDNGTTSPLTINVDDVKMNSRDNYLGDPWSTDEVGEHDCWLWYPHEEYNDESGATVKTYLGVKFTINVIPKVVTSLTWGAEPLKKSFPQSDKSYSLDAYSDGYVMAEFNDGENRKVGLKDTTITGIDITTVGKQTATVSYGEKSVTFDVTITEPVVVNTYVTAPTKTFYLVGETLSLSGAQVVFEYDNGQVEKQPLDSENDDFEMSLNGTINIESVLMGGDKTLNISYKGTELKQKDGTDIVITVTSRKGIQIKSEPTKKSYPYGTALSAISLDGLQLEVIFENDTVSAVPETEIELCDNSGFNPMSSGEKDIYVTAYGFITSFSIKIEQPKVDPVPDPDGPSGKDDDKDTDGQGTDGQGTDGQGTDGKGTDGKGSGGQGTDGKGTDGSGSGGQGGSNGGSSNGGSSYGGGSGSGSGGSGSGGSGNGGSGSGGSGNGGSGSDGSGNGGSANGGGSGSGNGSGSGSGSGNGSVTYNNEWVDGKWYDENGNCTYEGTLSWKSISTGWWVEDSAGWYPTDQWQKIDGIWYYFLPSGYMASGEYYNGYWFNYDGSWDGTYYLSWKSNSTGWWVEDISGWWPSSQWLKIDGYWYYFDASGYMVTNTYIDGYWLGADGACW